MIIEPELLKQAADDRVDAYEQTLKHIISDPMSVVESIGQTVFDAAEDEGIMYVAGYGLTSFVPVVGQAGRGAKGVTALGKTKVPVFYREKLATNSTNINTLGMEMKPLSEVSPQMFSVKGVYGKREVNSRRIDYTIGFNIEPKYSSYEQRVKTTPVNKGQWSNGRAESLFISDKTGEVKNILMKLVLTVLIIKTECRIFHHLRKVKLN